MQIKRTHVFGRGVPVAVLAGIMALSPALAPVSAYAASSQEIQSQLDDAQKKLDELSKNLEIAQSKYEQTQASLESTRAQIEDLKTQIAEKKQVLATKQASLSESVSASYKQGNSNIVDILVSSQSFSDLVSRVFYANKIADKYNAQIEEVGSLVKSLDEQQATLAAKESELTKLAAEQKQAKEDAEASKNETESYVNGLSADLQAALAAEREAAAKKAAEEAAAAAAAAEEAARQQAAAQQAAQAQQAAPAASSGSGQSTGSGSATGSGASTSRPTANSGSATGSSSSNGVGASAAAAIINAARAQLGLPYSWGASNPGVAFDCSGLTSYAYAAAGISIPHSSTAQYNQVKGKGNLKTSAGALQAGDLVFYQSGGTIYHVAIYIGGGSVIHANGYGQGVVITGVTYDNGFCGGGSPV